MPLPRLSQGDFVTVKHMHTSANVLKNPRDRTAVTIKITRVCKFELRLFRHIVDWHVGHKAFSTQAMEVQGLMISSPSPSQINRHRRQLPLWSDQCGYLALAQRLLRLISESDRQLFVVFNATTTFILSLTIVSPIHSSFGCPPCNLSINLASDPRTFVLRPRELTIDFASATEAVPIDHVKD